MGSSNTAEMPEVKYVDKAYLERQFKGFYDSIVLPKHNDLFNRIETLNGAEETENSVRNIAKEYCQETFQRIINGAPETFDTLKEVADWIQGDDSGAAAMAKRISDLESAATDHSTRIIQNHNDIDNIKKTLADMNSDDPENENSIVNKINNIINNLQVEDQDIDFDSWE